MARMTRAPGISSPLASTTPRTAPLREDEVGHARAHADLAAAGRDCLADARDDRRELVCAYVRVRVDEDVRAGAIRDESPEDRPNVAALDAPRVELAVAVRPSAPFAEAVVAVGVDDVSLGDGGHVMTRADVLSALEDDRAYAELDARRAAKSPAGPAPTMRIVGARLTSGRVGGAIATGPSGSSRLTSTRSWMRTCLARASIERLWMRRPADAPRDHAAAALGGLADQGRVGRRGGRHHEVDDSVHEPALKDVGNPPACGGKR